MDDWDVVGKKIDEELEHLATIDLLMRSQDLLKRWIPLDRNAIIGEILMWAPHYTVLCRSSDLRLGSKQMWSCRFVAPEWFESKHEDLVVAVCRAFIKYHWIHKIHEERKEKDEILFGSEV